MSDGFSPLEDAFFAAGEALAEQGEQGPEHATLDPSSEPAPESGRRSNLGRLKARLGPRLRSARSRLVLRARLLQLRVIVGLWTGLDNVRQGFFPPGYVAARCPAVARASLFVLVFTAATFPAAAVLAATGVL